MSKRGEQQWAAKAEAPAHTGEQAAGRSNVPSADDELAVEQSGQPQEEAPATWIVDAQGPGYMPISGAAIWIASKGLKVDIDPHDEVEITSALQALVDQIVDGHVGVVGYRDGKPDMVPAHLFTCPIAFLPSALDNERGAKEQMVLRSWAYDNYEIWENGFDDCLADQLQTYWGRLTVKRSDVLKLWPFPAENLGPAVPDMTGAPGRPTKSMNLISAEFERRFKARQAFEDRGNEAEYLLTWLANTHPGKPAPTKKTITNHISVRRREDLKA